MRAHTPALGGAESRPALPRGLTGQQGPEDSPHHPFPQLVLVAHGALPHPGEDKRESRLMGPGEPRPLLSPGNSSQEEVCGE